MNRRVEVEWLDAQTSTLSLTIEEIKNELKPLKTKSIGYLIHETPEYIILGFTDFGDGLIKHHQLIPKAIIKDICELRK